jgi:hypothetical protein
VGAAGAGKPEGMIHQKGPTEWSGGPML